MSYEPSYGILFAIKAGRCWGVVGPSKDENIMTSVALWEGYFRALFTPLVLGHIFYFEI